MRTVSSSIMAALVVIALFWGNCYSCPQAMLALADHQPAHQCCHHTKAPVTCPSPTLHNFVKADSGPSQAPAAPVVAMAIQPVTPAISSEFTFVTAEYTPPDLLSLNSSFRI